MPGVASKKNHDERKGQSKGRSLWALTEERILHQTETPPIVAVGKEIADPQETPSPLP